MTYLCKIAADCPHNLKICCGTCEHKDTCQIGCSSWEDWQTCADIQPMDYAPMQFESAVPEAIDKITALIQMKKDLDEQEKVLKQQLVEAMERYGVKSFENDQIKMLYVAPTVRSTIDSAKLKKEHPDLAERYTKTSNVSASVRVTVK